MRLCCGCYPSFFSGLIMINTLFAALLGGLLIGLVSGILENIMGVTPPILDDPLPEPEL